MSNGGHYLGQVGPYSITLKDLWGLIKPDEWLNDQVINALLKIFVDKKNSQTGNNILHVDSHAMTTILNGTYSPGVVEKIGRKLSRNSIVIGAYNEPSHWTLVAVYPATGEVVYLNSFGERSFHVRRVVRGWSTFMKDAGVNKVWTDRQIAHPRQKDSSSCGLFVIQFAYHIIFDGWTMDDIADAHSFRLDLAKILLTKSDDLSLHCPVCRQQCNDEKIKCHCQPPSTFHAECLNKMTGVICDFCTWTGRTESDSDLDADSDLDTLPDLSSETGNTRADVIDILLDMGFSLEDATIAEESCDGSVEDAVDWLDANKTSDPANITQEMENFHQFPTPKHKRHAPSHTVTSEQSCDLTYQEMQFTIKNIKQEVQEESSNPGPSQPAARKRPRPGPSQPAARKRPRPGPSQPAVTKRPRPGPSQPAATKRPCPGPSQPAMTKRPRPGPSQPAVTKRPHLTPQCHRPFTLKFKTKQITRCRGCLGTIAHDPPPANLVVGHYNSYPYFDQTKGGIQPGWKQGYFHTNFSCLKAKNPDFQGDEVVVPLDMMKDLTPEHIQYCERHGIHLNMHGS
ncbi:uncharacterized protein LOC144927435 [Branchiostoma floridae x Branchiostoma belcheri]